MSSSHKVDWLAGYSRFPAIKTTAMGENRLRWVLDVSFRNDFSHLRTGHGPHNMATVRPMVMNQL